MDNFFARFLPIHNRVRLLHQRPALSKSVSEQHINVFRNQCVSQGLAGQMQTICQAAGAPVLELTLPKDEEEEGQRENANPNASGLKPKQEVTTLGD